MLVCEKTLHCSGVPFARVMVVLKFGHYVRGFQMVSAHGCAN